MEKFFLEIFSLREARVVRFAAVNINIYGIPLEKFRIMWMALLDCFIASVIAVVGFHTEGKHFVIATGL